MKNLISKISLIAIIAIVFSSCNNNPSVEEVLKENTPVAISIGSEQVQGVIVGDYLYTEERNLNRRLTFTLTIESVDFHSASSIEESIYGANNLSGLKLTGKFIRRFVVHPIEKGFSSNIILSSSSTIDSRTLLSLTAGQTLILPYLRKVEEGKYIFNSLYVMSDIIPVK